MSNNTTAAGVHKQPEAALHGAAWHYFCIEAERRRYGPQETRDAWLWFLAGWKAKVQQRQDLRSR